MDTKKIIRVLLVISVLALTLTFIPILSNLPPELQEVSHKWDTVHTPHSLYFLVLFLIIFIGSYISSIVLTWRMKNIGIYMMLVFYSNYYLYMVMNGIDISTSYTYILDHISDMAYVSAATILYLKNKKGFSL